MEFDLDIVLTNPWCPEISKPPKEIAAIKFPLHNHSILVTIKQMRVHEQIVHTSDLTLGYCNSRAMLPSIYSIALGHNLP